jgi:Family of unknown function (DUF5413)
VKRIVIFVLLGPPLGMITGLYGMLPVLNWSLGEPSLIDFHQFVLLPLAYVIGLIPALIVGCFDAALAHRRVRGRIAWTTLFAAVACYIPLMTSIGMGFIGGPFLLLFGLIGAVPAALCSWLGSRLADKTDQKASATT